MYVYCYNCFRKARRKEKEGTDPATGDSKLYLEATVLERKLPDMDLKLLVDLPPGLDYNEWLASHSKYCYHMYIDLFLDG